MSILTLLEHLANNAHHRIDINELIGSQSEEFQKAFLANNGTWLKNQFVDSSNLADKSVVVQIVDRPKV